MKAAVEPPRAAVRRRTITRQTVVVEVVRRESPADVIRQRIACAIFIQNNAYCAKVVCSSAVEACRIKTDKRFLIIYAILKKSKHVTDA